ncbi:YqaE/Pmp3 family membrane protein [Terasakiella sp. A23]|uniref:YqaE/Pmp3 family membrane protein n=1 Tax=Terasakiella sp. FCG-A23 TaxID=3080561 RepID=UPI002953FB6E|nr:YqaE/Pmp3 family membrane protein [Terasakiella sp. A23]MDV7341657.1 YqaE/Pmp3 family membrane protein [Terasakiella sp. A23]
MDIIRIIIAIFIPPLAAFLTVGLGLQFWLNLILTLCFFVPGMIHALWLVVKNNR